MKYLIKLSFILHLFLSLSYAHDSGHQSTGESNMSEKTKQANIVLDKENLKLLSNTEKAFTLVLNMQGAHNKTPITLFRFEPNDTVHIEHQNVSFLINSKNQLQGFSRLLPQFSSSEQQVTKETAGTIATKFLEEYAPDLLVNSETNWIDAHDETIIVNGKKSILRGMKVKCRDLNTGLYFWIIVAPDGSIMVFERDVVWDFLKAGRQTEKWLHDSWLKKRLS